MEGTVPFCGGCQRDITECRRFSEPPCSHFYCEICLDQMHVCPIDGTSWEAGRLRLWDSLKAAVEQYKRRPTNFTLNSLYEEINVNDVVCKRAADPHHQRKTCKYHHTAVHEQQPSEGGWICQKCSIKNDYGSPRCTFCLSLPRSPSASRVQGSPRQSPRAHTPEPVRRSPEPQQWVCAYCGFSTSEESHLCLNCDRTNEAVKQKLAQIGRNMQLCPTCKKLNVFSAARCSECKGPMHQYLASPPKTPTWLCTFCREANAESGSWICGKCSKTNAERRENMKAEGKEMVKCPNRRCQKLCPWGAEECSVCRETLPQACLLCGQATENGKCRNCERSKRQKCNKCGEELIQGQCPDCIPQQQCRNCGLDMVQGRCSTCEAKRLQGCRTCGGPVVLGHCERCESRKSAKCSKCGRELTSGKCNSCALSRPRSPSPSFGLSSLERPPLPEHRAPESRIPAPLPQEQLPKSIHRSPSPLYPRRGLNPVSRPRADEFPVPRPPGWSNRVQNYEQKQGYKAEAEGQQQIQVLLVVFALLGCLYFLIAGG